MVSANGGPKKFFYARTLRVLAPGLLQINITIVWFVIEYIIVCCNSSLKMFYKKICWEKIHENCFEVVGPSALRASEVRSTEAYTSGMDYKSILTNWFCKELSRNEWDIGFWGLFWLLQKRRQFLDFERSVKGIFWETRKSTLLENPISKPFLKLGFLKFCRHFCLHRIHEWIQK